MSALRIVGSGLSCAVFAGLGAFVGSEIGEAKIPSSDGKVLGAIAGGAVGALLLGALTSAGSAKACEKNQLLQAISRHDAMLANPRFV